MKNRLRRLLLYFHTARYLRLIQIYRRIWQRLYRPKVKKTNIPYIRKISSKWYSPVIKPNSFLPPARFRFLNKEYEVRAKEDWNNPNYEKLWLYNLHYFDYLNSKVESSIARQFQDLIKKWIIDNPPFFGNGWEPYTLSRRIVNWIKWFWLGNETVKEFVECLTIQTRYLSKNIEWHLLGNHLIANAKALIFAGLFFKGKEADEWFHKGAKLFLAQLKEQILPDGGHFERSPMYHAIILEDVLDVLNAISSVQREDGKIFRALQETGFRVGSSMLSWLQTMTHPDGKFVLFNDCAFDGAHDYQALKSYAESLGIKSSSLSSYRTMNGSGIEVVHLKESGYIRVNWGDLTAFIDVAPIGPDYQPGHGHADTLSFELSLGKERFLVDSGVSLYEECPERLRQRGTPAHNTVVIDDRDSSEVWGAFRVARRAYPMDLKIEQGKEACFKLAISCSHNGYKHLSGSPIHRRKWCFSNNGLIIYDRIEGKFEKAEAHLHFHPDVRLTYMDNSGLRGTENIFRASLPNGKGFQIIMSKGKASIINTTWHPEFGSCYKNQCLKLEFMDREVETELILKHI